MTTRPIADIRRANARTAIDRAGGVGKVAKAMGHKSPSFLTQQAGPNPTRNVTEKTAREMEKALKLPANSLDREDGVPMPVVAKPAAQGPVVSTELVAAVIRLVGQVAEGEHVVLAPAKFATLLPWRSPTRWNTAESRALNTWLRSLDF